MFDTIAEAVSESVLFNLRVSAALETSPIGHFHMSRSGLISRFVISSARNTCGYVAFRSATV